jgi:hypothetical protein
MYDLSIVIPSRNEVFLSKTIEHILENIEGNTEIIAVLDGCWADPPIKDDKRVTLIHHAESIGQRAASNEAVRLSQAKYIMKIDAHCAVDKGFDVKMMKAMKDNYTMAPVMRNLHAFDWVCEDGHRRYQGPSGPCATCQKPTKMEIMWIAKRNPQSTSYCFDPTPHFQYFTEYRNRAVRDGVLTESMSLQGSCFMLTRDKYLELNICDEEFGSWGSQGIEVAVKTWLSGGRVVINHDTYYAHMFRTQGGDFGFPYHLSGRQVEKAKKIARDIFFENKWEKQVHPLSWLVEKFWPVPGWSEEDLKKLKESGSKFLNVSMPTLDLNKEMPSDAISTSEPTKGVIYYTDNQCDEVIAEVSRKQLKKAINGLPLVSVSLKPIDFGTNYVLNAERSVLTMFRQILMALEKSTADIIFHCEHDVLYHPSHFDFTPSRKDMFYYNDNKWKVDASSGQALFYHCAQVSGLCGYRELLLTHYRDMVARVEKEGYNHGWGYEPGTHTKQFELWNSSTPNIDIRHNSNLTRNRWNQEQFRNKNSCLGWTMADEVSGWGVTKGRMKEFLEKVGEINEKVYT